MALSPELSGKQDWKIRAQTARDGSDSALGELLNACRPYLLLIANKELPDQIQAKGGASDLVQDTFLEARRDFHQFQGGTEAELLGWLRGILLHNVANFTRRFRDTDKRAVGREVAFEIVPPNDLAQHDSPGARLVRRERDEALHAAIERLPPHYREAVIARNYEGLSFSELGERLGSSEEAARKVWTRAIEHLQELLGPKDAWFSR